MKSRKLPMVKRKTAQQISVTLTKRRQGLFNKAAELSTLCDSQIAVLVSARKKDPLKQKIYSFGHSSVPSVLRAFLTNSVPVPIPVAGDFVSAGSTVEDLSVLDGFERSESLEELSRLVEGLEKLVDCAKGNETTSNSDLADFDFDFDFDDHEPNGNTEYPISVMEQNGMSRGEDMYLSVTSKDDEFLLQNEYQDTNIPYIDCAKGNGTSNSDLADFDFDFDDHLLEESASFPDEPNANTEFPICVTEESNMSRGEDECLSFTSNDDEFPLDDEYQDSIDTGLLLHEDLCSQFWSNPMISFVFQ